MVTMDVTIRINPALKEDDRGDRGPTDRHDPTHQSRSARARRSAARSALRAVQHLPHSRLSLQSRPAPAPRPIPPAQLQPPRTKPHREHPPRTHRRGQLPDRQLPQAARTHRPVDRHRHRTGPPPTQHTQISVTAANPTADAPSLQTDTGHPASALKPQEYRAFRTLDTHLPRSYAWLRSRARAATTTARRIASNSPFGFE